MFQYTWSVVMNNVLCPRRNAAQKSRVTFDRRLRCQGRTRLFRDLVAPLKVDFLPTSTCILFFSQNLHTSETACDHSYVYSGRAPDSSWNTALTTRSGKSGYLASRRSPIIGRHSLQQSLGQHIVCGPCLSFALRSAIRFCLLHV